MNKVMESVHNWRTLCETKSMANNRVAHIHVGKTISMKISSCKMIKVKVGNDQEMAQ